MRRLPRWVYHFIVLLFFLTTSMNSFYTPFDVFGLYYGIIPYPMNTVVLLLILLLLSLISYAADLLISQFHVSRELSPVISTNLVVLVFSLLISVDYVIGIVFSWGVIGFSIISMVLLERDRTESFLSRVSSFQVFLFATAMVITLVNYSIWFIRGREGIDLPIRFTNAFRDIPVEVEMDQVVYAQKIFTATLITFTVNALIFFALTYYIWARSSTLISKIRNYSPLIGVVHKGRIFEFIDEDDQTITAVSSVGRGLESLSSSVFQEDHDDIPFDVRRVEGWGLNALKESELSPLIEYSGVRLKKPLLVLCSGCPPLENIFVRSGHVVSLANHMTILRELSMDFVPPTMPAVKRILHISSDDLNSAMLRAKVNRILSPTGHILVNTGFGDLDEEIFVQRWDMLLVSTHGGLDADGIPYFVDSEGTRHAADVFIDSFQQKPVFVLFASCKSVSTEGIERVVKPLLGGGTALFIGSLSNVIASHLPLVSLPFLGSILDLRGRLDIIHVQNVLEEIYDAVKNFGFSAQWSFFRSFVPSIWKGRF